MFSLSDGALYASGVGLWIDSPRRRARCYVSHGHGDHARPHARVVTSVANARVCRARFGTRGDEVIFEEHALGEPWMLGEHRLELFSAGHILGSTQLLIEGERGRFVYTGDFKLEPSHTAEPPEVKSCDELLMECTYGHPQFRFPPREEIAAQMVGFARAALEAGKVPVFSAYTLGKAQEALAILGFGGVPVCAHPGIAALAGVYEDAGVRLPAYSRYDANAFDGEAALVWPVSGQPVPHTAGGRRTRTAALTGWIHTRRGPRNADAGFALSDHADFPALLRYVELAQPRKVWLTHGFPEFARELRRRGVDAAYLTPNAQLSLF